MSKTVQFLAAVYPDRTRAYVTLNVLRELERSNTITLADAALITRNVDGKIRIEEMTEETPRKESRRGMIVAGVFGIVASTSMHGATSVDETTGPLPGCLGNIVIKTAHVRQVADDLRPGEAAVVVLVEDWVATLKVQQAIGTVEGILVAEVFDEETISDIYMQAAAGD